MGWNANTRLVNIALDGVLAYIFFVALIAALFITGIVTWVAFMDAQSHSIRWLVFVLLFTLAWSIQHVVMFRCFVP